MAVPRFIVGVTAMTTNKRVINRRRNRIGICSSLAHACLTSPQVGFTYIAEWSSTTYPDSMTEGSGDQEAIMTVICSVKQDSFDSLDCIGENEVSI